MLSSVESASSGYEKSLLRPWLTAALFFALFFCSSLLIWQHVPMSQDSYLHVTVGRWILQEHAVPRDGIFSGTLPHAPWLAHEWLSSVAMAVLYDHFGQSGLLAATAAMLAIAVSIVTFEVSRAAGLLIGLLAGLFVWGLCLGHTVARPHMAALPFIAAWVAIHVRARRHNSVPPIAAAALICPWANLHGSSIMGPVFTCMFAAEAIYEATSIKEARRTFLHWSRFLLATLAAALVTPFGLAELLFPFRLFGMAPALGGITEWQPSSVANNTPLILFVLIVLLLALNYGIRVQLPRITMFLILLFMAFKYERHTELFAVASPLLLLDFIVGIAKVSESSVALKVELPKRPLATATLCIALVSAPLASLWFIGTHIQQGFDKFTPKAAVNWAIEHDLEGQVLNAYNFGGYLIFRGIPPFIDGRVDLYGNDFVTSYFALNDLSALLEKYQIAWTIFEPLNPRNLLLDQMPGWSLAYADSEAVIHVRSRSFGNKSDH
jgi:hypothetical protein